MLPSADTEAVMPALVEPRPMVLTLVPPTDRAQFDAAAEGCFIPLHASTAQEAVRTVRERPVNAVLIAPSAVPPDALGHVARIADGFGVPTVAVLSGYDPAAAQRLLQFGASGIRRSVDLSARDGWRTLRELLAHPATPTAARILAHVLPALEPIDPVARLYFRWLVTSAPRVTSVRAMLRPLGVPASTFMSRFLRAGLPSPKQYLIETRLLHAAALLERPSLSVADVAYRLEFSSPQSFGRQLRQHLGCTATAFRRRYSLAYALAQFELRMITPFRPAFRSFRPFLATETGTLGHADPDARAEGY